MRKRIHIVRLRKAAVASIVLVAICVSLFFFAPDLISRFIGSSNESEDDEQSASVTVVESVNPPLSEMTPDLSVSSEDDFDYVVHDDGITITGYKGQSGNVLIPDRITDMDVVAIGERVFFERRDMVSVVMPNSVTEIGDYSFFGCSNLTSLELPYGVISIGEQAFRGCSNLKYIEIPESVKDIGKRAFFGCNSLTSAVIPSSVSSIGIEAFHYIWENATRILPNLTVVSPEDSYAFNYCVENNIQVSDSEEFD